MKTGLDYRNKITFARVFFSQIAKKKFAQVKHIVL